MRDHDDIPIWQLPFRALFGIVVAGIIPAVVGFGFLFSITFIMWFFGMRDSVWPLWPF